MTGEVLPVPMPLSVGFRDRSFQLLALIPDLPKSIRTELQGFPVNPFEDKRHHRHTQRLGDTAGIPWIIPARIKGCRENCVYGIFQGFFFVDGKECCYNMDFGYRATTFGPETKKKTWQEI